MYPGANVTLFVHNTQYEHYNQFNTKQKVPASHQEYIKPHVTPQFIYCNNDN